MQPTIIQILPHPIYELDNVFIDNGVLFHRWLLEQPIGEIEIIINGLKFHFYTIEDRKYFLSGLDLAVDWYE